MGGAKYAILAIGVSYLVFAVFLLFHTVPLAPPGDSLTLYGVVIAFMGIGIASIASFFSEINHETRFGRIESKIDAIAKTVGAIHIDNRRRDGFTMVSLVIGLIGLVAGVAIVLAYLGTGDLDLSSFFVVWIWPIVAGIVSSVIVIGLTYYLQTPKLDVVIANDKYDGKSDLHYVHLRVRNVRRPFLRGGAATNCRGTIALQDGRSFVTKWATRPNPLRVQKVVKDHEVEAVPVVDDVLIDEAKIEYIRPGEEKPLDVAVRMKGDPACYIHEPENFKVPNYRPDKNKLGIGEFTFTCVIRYDGGQSPPFRFKIVNQDGGSPGLLSLANTR